MNVIASVLPTGAATEASLAGVKTTTATMNFTGSSLDVNVTGGASNSQYADGALIAGGEVGTIAIGSDGTNLQNVKVDAAGELQVDVLSSALPTGAASEATLSSLDGKDFSTETTLAAIKTQTDKITFAPGMPGNDLKVVEASAGSINSNLNALWTEAMSPRTALDKINSNITARKTGAAVVSSQE